MLKSKFMKKKAEQHGLRVKVKCGYCGRRSVGYINSNVSGETIQVCIRHKKAKGGK